METNANPNTNHCGLSFERHVTEFVQAMKFVGQGLGCKGTLQALAEVLDFARRSFNIDVSAKGLLTKENIPGVIQKGTEEIKAQIEQVRQQQQFKEFEKFGTEGKVTLN